MRQKVSFEDQISACPLSTKFHLNYNEELFFQVELASKREIKNRFRQLILILPATLKIK